MDFKKIAATTAASVMMLSMAMPAFANYNYHPSPRHSQDPKVTVAVKNFADLDLNTSTVAKTGENFVSGCCSQPTNGCCSQNNRHHQNNTAVGATIYSGAAQSESLIGADVNSTYVGLDRMPRNGSVNAFVGTYADVDTNTTTIAKTGKNSIINGGTIGTGTAYAGSMVDEVVNSTIVAL